MSRYEKYKDSGIAWIGEIPEDWEVMSLKGIFNESNERSDLGDETLLSLSQYTGIRPKSESSVSDSHIAESYIGYKLVKKGQLVMNIMLAWNGSYALSDFDGMISPAYCVYDFKIDCSKKYYHYLLKIQGYPDAFKTVSRGIIESRLRLYPEQFYKFSTLVPPTIEQQAIAEFLDNKCAEIDELVRLQEVMIEELKAYKQSVITEAVTRGLDPDAPLRDSGIAWIGEIPEHWEVKRLKFAAKSHSDKLLGNENLMYIGLENIVSSSAKYIETKNEYDKSQAISCKVNDVIFGKLRPYLAKALLISEVVCCSSEFAVFSVVQNPNYFKFLLLSDWFVKIVDASTYGAKMPRANIDFINNMFITAPPCAEQQAIADYLDQKSEEIDTLITLKQQKIEQLKEYKKSVIFEYVTGKKRVQQ